MHMICTHGGDARITLQRGHEWNAVQEILRALGIRPPLVQHPGGVQVSLSATHRQRLAEALRRDASSARQRHRWAKAAILSRWAHVLHRD